MTTTTTAFEVRVRRGDREVEVQGPTEEFVRELLTELVEEHFQSAPRTSLAPESVAAPADGGNADSGNAAGDDRSLQELVNAAPRASAAEKVALAAYVLRGRGQDSFGRDDVRRLFDEAMERDINFHREVTKAARRGHVMRAMGGVNRYRLTNTGLAHVRNLTGATEVV